MVYIDMLDDRVLVMWLVRVYLCCMHQWCTKWGCTCDDMHVRVAMCVLCVVLSVCGVSWVCVLSLECVYWVYVKCWVCKLSVFECVHWVCLVCWVHVCGVLWSVWSVLSVCGVCVCVCVCVVTLYKWIANQCRHIKQKFWLFYQNYIITKAYRAENKVYIK